MTPACAPSPGPRRAVAIDESRDREFDAFIATGSTEGCVEGASAILRLINTIVAESVTEPENAENEAKTATFAALVSERYKP
jgi:hypothetical protein